MHVVVHDMKPQHAVLHRQLSFEELEDWASSSTLREKTQDRIPPSLTFAIDSYSSFLRGNVGRYCAGENLSDSNFVVQLTSTYLFVVI